jgi:ribosomal protein L25, Ctc-form
MKLAITSRSCEKKRDAKRLRTNQKIPAVLYNKGKESSPITIDRLEFDALLRDVPKGQLSTAIFSMKDEQGTEYQAIIKEVQYNKTNYKVEHLDFVKLDGKHRVNVNVPVVLLNVVDCIGTKLGGQISQLIRQIKVNCPGDKIPASFQIDVRDMNVDEIRKIKDIKVDEDVKAIISENEVIFDDHEEIMNLAENWVIFGLGNIGPRYRFTRHNIGFMVVDEIAKQFEAEFKEDRRLSGRVAKTAEGANSTKS